MHEWKTKSFYLVCTAGFKHVLPAQTEKEVIKHKEYLHKLGYTKILVYCRDDSLSMQKLLGKI